LLFETNREQVIADLVAWLGCPPSSHLTISCG
jgi:hypothetical protein